MNLHRLLSLFSAFKFPKGCLSVEFYSPFLFPHFKTLVMASSAGSSRILLSSSSSSNHTHPKSNGVRDVSDQANNLSSRPSGCPMYEWVDPPILDILLALGVHLP